MDVTDATFESAVIERSRSVPVVVDFWAAWCGPCRMLTPVLEREVARRDGAVELAKLDVDANPGTANSYRIQGIPAVKAFRDGRVVAEFVGAQPAIAVSRFLDSLVPSQAELLARNGDEDSLRQALKLNPVGPMRRCPLPASCIAAPSWMRPSTYLAMFAAASRQTGWPLVSGSRRRGQTGSRLRLARWTTATLQALSKRSSLRSGLEGPTAKTSAGSLSAFSTSSAPMTRW